MKQKERYIRKSCQVCLVNVQREVSHAFMGEGSESWQFRPHPCVLTKNQWTPAVGGMASVEGEAGVELGGGDHILLNGMGRT